MDDEALVQHQFRNYESNNVTTTSIAVLASAARYIAVVKMPSKYQNHCANLNSRTTNQTYTSSAFPNIHKYGSTAELATTESQNELQGSQRPATNANWW